MLRPPASVAFAADAAEPATAEVAANAPEPTPPPGATPELICPVSLRANALF